MTPTENTEQDDGRGLEPFLWLFFIYLVVMFGFISAVLINEDYNPEAARNGSQNWFLLSK